ncbi:hypothetical protein VFPPC_15369 [Pochonia chlamydosporia 170]|uniref:Uncharacterized protein n=1 Tax=Pochonia chlamydosporia 170 TaxID=1380566 RepID=A0A179G7R3_METCM|nr:hypothetical protein VFPPC_15369 [Pochonia chlamydosporia 170]OAQ73832.2 hypothetical protein VFPPC_15369 [Pochonia chlamydosporia 170]
MLFDTHDTATSKHHTALNQHGRGDARRRTMLSDCTIVTMHFGIQFPSCQQSHPPFWLWTFSRLVIVALLLTVRMSVWLPAQRRFSASSVHVA